MHRDTLAFLDAHRAERVAPLTQLLASTIQVENPDYRDGLVVTRADLEDSCRSNITRVLELLAASLDVTVPEGDHQVYDAAKETGRRRAEQGIPPGRGAAIVPARWKVDLGGPAPPGHHRRGAGRRRTP